MKKAVRCRGRPGAILQMLANGADISAVADGYGVSVAYVRSLKSRYKNGDLGLSGKRSERVCKVEDMRRAPSGREALRRNMSQLLKMRAGKLSVWEIRQMVPHLEEAR